MYVLPIYDEERQRVTGYCEVSEDVYRAYWHEVNRERRKEREIHSREISWQGVSDMPDEDTLSFHAAQKPPDPESAAQSAALQEALAAEPPELVEALWALANGEKTQREIAKEWDVSQSTVSRRLEKLCENLRMKLDTPLFDDYHENFLKKI